MIGARLGGWILDSELGRGGMARVFLAHAEAAPSSLAAVKVLPAELAVDTAFPARFQREIDILRQLDHPNIVRFLESGVHEGCSFFAMEYIDGPNVETLLQEHGRLPWPEVLDLAMQIAPALKHAHDRGIIHRDLKPANLLIALRHFASPGSLGQVKLTDFGVASLFAGTHLTKTGNVVGTAEYLSPEQALGKPVTRRSDLYSLGAVLYRLLTGRTPFEGTVVDLLHKHVYAQFERPMPAGAGHSPGPRCPDRADAGQGPRTPACRWGAAAPPAGQHSPQDGPPDGAAAWLHPLAGHAVEGSGGRGRRPGGTGDLDEPAHAPPSSSRKKAAARCSSSSTNRGWSSHCSCSR